jgi:hypothetical protein
MFMRVPCDSCFATVVDSVTLRSESGIEAQLWRDRSPASLPCAGLAVLRTDGHAVREEREFWDDFGSAVTLLLYGKDI